MNIRFVRGTPFSFGEGPGMRQLTSITTVQVCDATKAKCLFLAGPIILPFLKLGTLLHIVQLWKLYCDSGCGHLLQC